MKSAFRVSKGLFCLYDKQNNTWLLVDMEFLFSCSTRHFTRELSSETLDEKFHIYARPCILYIWCESVSWEFHMIGAVVDVVSYFCPLIEIWNSRRMGDRSISYKSWDETKWNKVQKKARWWRRRRRWWWGWRQCVRENFRDFSVYLYGTYFIEKYFDI